MTPHCVLEDMAKTILSLLLIGAGIAASSSVTHASDASIMWGTASSDVSKGKGDSGKDGGGDSGGGGCSDNSVGPW